MKQLQNHRANTTATFERAGHILFFTTCAAVIIVSGAIKVAYPEFHHQKLEPLLVKNQDNHLKLGMDNHFYQEGNGYPKTDSLIYPIFDNFHSLRSELKREKQLKHKAA